MTEALPEIDYTKWQAPGEGDVRSPCPMINALANHSILPHNGKGITKEMAVKALGAAIHLDSNIASIFAAGGVAANPDHSAHTFDLNHVNKHNWIEHDCSLSRDDFAFGDNWHFNKEVFDSVMAHYGTAEKTDFAHASKARYLRIQASKEAHKRAGKEFTYGIKECIMSYGETALYLNLLGKDGVAPLKWVRIFFGSPEEERLPFAEGWRKPAQPINQTLMNKTIFSLVSANEHKAEEATEVGVGTIQALKTVVESFIKVPSICTVM
ncbi:Cloroperoxidase [Trichodelitschia bisporula]|uniref:Cloroperoxidase n=1 Tax=Trichodelitschia bisporula TaxID=703511 RepID=A0A6G1HTF9_9PEZI|nr:Cloroperoxidase [Trichodelitschia bisporula]